MLLLCTPIAEIEEYITKKEDEAKIIRESYLDDLLTNMVKLRKLSETFNVTLEKFIEETENLASLMRLVDHPELPDSQSDQR